MIPAAGEKSAHARGREGEEAAAAALEREGMGILCRNFRSEQGEIDLVAQDGEVIVFVEVKNWPAFGLADLDKSINEEKRRRIMETAKYFLSIHREYNDRPLRFDVVFLSRAGDSYTRFESAWTEM